MEPKPKGINKLLKHFFFSAFKNRAEIKEIGKVIGEVKEVAIIITPNKSVMRAISDNDKRDTPWTEDDTKKFCKLMNIKEETVKGLKSVYIILNFKDKTISIKQVKKDGTPKEFVV